MWVRSQDKKILAKYIKFSITGSKKIYIHGKRKYDGFFESTIDVLGKYDSLEEAQKELDNIQINISENKNFYEIK
ncbi:MAG: hypothetical protein ACQESN_05815 [Thermotogota bacterium]